MSASRPENISAAAAAMALNSVSTAVVPFEPIAVVGVGMRAPGGIDSFASLWDTLIQRKSHHACLATDPRFLRRFNPEDFNAMFSVTPDARATLHGNLLDDTPGLDEAFFGVNKRDSACMDVQQKLLLHVAHEALEDAGFSGATDGSALDPATFGVYIGSATDDFFKDPNSYPIDIYHLVRSQRAFLSGQISHHFGLHGPSVSVDTVCAGAMTAFNDACRALATGECRAAIAGGVHVMSPISAPPTVMSLKLAGFLDPKGQCKPFLADGGGYCRAEACGLAVLKRLSDAVRDGDRIHGVIRGIGAGNMASARSIVRPDGPLQSVALARAVASSGIDPACISFVEAHGPGTQQGDPAELFSICSVLAPHGSRQCPNNTLAIGSIKGNVGHSEAASGATSLFKVLAMMRHQRIPPQASFHPSKMNPLLNPFFDRHPIRISDHDQEWNASRRVAVVSNFGASGYAGHMVVEDPSPFVPSAGSSRVKAVPLPFMISAKDRSTLLTLARSYADWLDGEGAPVPLADISYATTARRVAHSSFTLLQAESHADLARQLRQDALPIVDALSAQPRTLAFCFSGQGGPRLDPRQSSLYGISAAFTSAVDTCFRLSENEQLVAPDDVDALELFALQAGLAEMWTSWGATPVALAGHSFGEYVTLVRAGVLTLRDALKLVGTRASLIREKCAGTPSKMAALRLPLAKVRELLSQQQMTRVELACINSDDRVTLAGTPEDLRAFHEEVLKIHPTCRWQIIDNMRAAFHSQFVEPLCEEFSRACKDIDFRPSNAVVLSGPLGRTCFPGDGALLQTDYLVRHCRETNSFGEAVLDYKRVNEAAGVCQPDWIELGPHSTTVGFIPFSSGQLKLASHHKGVAGWTTTLDTLTTLRAAGHAIDFAAFHRDINPAARHIDLPRYPFQLQPHAYPVRKANHVSSGSLDGVTYPRVTSAEMSHILRSHVVANQSICPASVYMALVLTAASVDGRKEKPAYRLSRLVMKTPFTNLTDDWLQVRATFSSPKAPPSSFDVVSKGGQVHASMQIDICEEAVLLDSLSLLKPLVLPLRSIKDLPGTNVLDTRLAYDLFSRTVCYGPHCQGLRRVWIAGDGHQAWAHSSNEPEEAAHRHELEPASLRKFSPILIDRACQLVGLLINTSRARAHDEIFVASEIDQVEISLSKIHDSVSFESYASFELADNHGTESTTAIGQVFTFDQEQRLVAAFRGVRMRRMKQRTVEHLVRRASGESATPMPTTGPNPVRSSHPPLAMPKKEVDASLSDELRKRVSAIVQTTLGMDHIPADRKLDELGLDSLTAVEIGVELERLLPGRKLPGELLVKPNTTLDTLFEALDMSSAERMCDATAATQIVALSNHDDGGSARTPGGAVSTPDVTDGAMAILERIGTNPETIQDKPGTVPLMLIHDGGGTALAYRLLGNVGRTLLGVHSPGLHEGKGIVSIRHAADQYASFARQWLDKSSHRPRRLLVGGWSLGGVIAIALAAAHPELVSGIILLDSPPPGTAPMKSDEAERLIPAANTRASCGLSALVRTQLKMNARSLNVDNDHQGGRRALVARLKAPVYLISAIEPLSRVETKEPEPTSPGSCSAWMLSHDRANLAEAAWKETLGDLLIGTQRIPGDHFTMFTQAHATNTTRAVQQAVDALEAWQGYCPSSSDSPAGYA